MARTVDPTKCIGDKLCADVCPVDCITFPAADGGKAVMDPDECIDCDACVAECPTEAILVA